VTTGAASSRGLTFSRSCAGGEFHAGHVSGNNFASSLRESAFLKLQLRAPTYIPGVCRHGTAEYEESMSTFLYRCPVTGYRVQGLIADNPSHPTETNGHTFEPLTCTVCGHIHLVNPKSGKLLGDKNGLGDKDEDAAGGA
jgi:hypothetical protein